MNISREAHYRFVSLDHGTTKDDMSHWYNNIAAALRTSAGPIEYSSFVNDDTPYLLTTREAALTGLARFDSLHKLAEKTSAAHATRLLVMPTWRSYLAQLDPASEADREVFAASDYAENWRALLNDEQLHEILEQSRLKLCFMPHPNARPFLESFELRQEVITLTKADIGIQELFASSAMMITDYSSVAFDMALIRRPVIYFHFDRERFYGGDHNWRPGYFSYQRDGFGPVCKSRKEVAEALNELIANDCSPSSLHLANMRAALPDHDGKACERIFEAISRL